MWYHAHTDQDPKFFAAIKTILLDQILVLTHADMTPPGSEDDVDSWLRHNQVKHRQRRRALGFVGSEALG